MSYNCIFADNYLLEINPLTLAITYTQIPTQGGTGGGSGQGIVVNSVVYFTQIDYGKLVKYSIEITAWNEYNGFNRPLGLSRMNNGSIYVAENILGAMYSNITRFNPSDASRYTRRVDGSAYDVRAIGSELWFTSSGQDLLAKKFIQKFGGTQNPVNQAAYYLANTPALIFAGYHGSPSGIYQVENAISGQWETVTKVISATFTDTWHNVLNGVTVATNLVTHTTLTTTTYTAIPTATQAGTVTQTITQTVTQPPVTVTTTKTVTVGSTTTSSTTSSSTSSTTSTSTSATTSLALIPTHFDSELMNFNTYTGVVSGKLVNNVGQGVGYKLIWIRSKGYGSSFIYSGYATTNADGVFSYGTGIQFASAEARFGGDTTHAACIERYGQTIPPP